jgi:hypothetical protein
LYFEKAFNTIEHLANLKILRCKGFSEVFIEWVQHILFSRSSAVLLNGVLGRHFACKRGVRQGDPLSPLLYVFGGDLLQSHINHSFIEDMLRTPILNRETTDFPIIQYAYDTIIVMEADQLVVLKEILEEYTAFTGLEANFHKSSPVPINLNEEETNSLANMIGCSTASMPFTYLGLPMGTTKPTIRELSPLIDRVEKILTHSASFF